MKRVYFFTGLGIFLAFLLIIAVRFDRIKYSDVHYHANFAVYINGQREAFANPLYYEEVQTCTDDFENDPKHRAHMHDQKNDIVHAHAKAATWGHFFANLGWGLTKNTLQTDEQIFIEGAEGSKLTFYLNGNEIDSVANKVIGSEDVLLIDYGNTPLETIKANHNSIVRSAAEANTKQDPSSCSGNKLSAKDRLTRALKFWE